MKASVKRVIKKLLFKFDYKIKKILRSYLKSEWQDNLQEEIKFWDGWLGTESERFIRLDPNAKLQNWFLEYIDKTQSKNRILDVGAGPLTDINKKCDFAVIEICAVDVLADEYDKLLRKHNIQPIVRTQMCDGERLTEKFDENTFDITYSNNALDHSHNPLKCIKEMIQVTKKEHYVFIKSFLLEGTNACWSGLHKWDFFVKRDARGRNSLILAGRDLKEINITDLFRSRLEQVRLDEDRNNKTVIAVYKKRQ